MHAYECIGSIVVWNHPSFGGGRWSLEEYGGEGGGHLWDHALIGSVKSLNRNHLLMPHEQTKKISSLQQCIILEAFLSKKSLIPKYFSSRKNLFVKKNFYLETNYNNLKFHSL